MGLSNELSQWQESYCFGDREVDEGRKKVFVLAQKFLEQQSLQEDEKKVVLKEIIDELTFYLGTQFYLEQDFYNLHNYPYNKEHTALHKASAEKFNAFLANLSNLSLEEVEKQLEHLLEEQFIKHISEEDTKYNQWKNSLDSYQKTFDWEESFSIGDETIDNGNKALFEIAQDAFHDSPCCESRDEKIRKTMNFIYEYLKTNFRHEEALMKEHNYARMPQHILRHRNIIKQMNRLAIQLPHSDTEHFEKQLANMLEATFVYHVMDEDENLRKWLRETACQ